MKLEASIIPLGHLHSVVPDIIPLLKKSEFWASNRVSVDDLLGFLFSNKMQLWVVYNPDDARIYAHLMTEYRDYPRKKILVVQYCAGDYGSLEGAEEQVHQKLEQFAKYSGCAGIEFFGRPGWRSNAKKHGYTVQTVVYEKHFDGEQL